MQVTKYRDLLQDAEGFDDWLIRLGLRVKKNDRIHQAFDVLRTAQAATQKRRGTGEETRIAAEHLFPLTEAFEAIEVYRAFGSECSEALAQTLKRALGGPHQPADEKSIGSRDGRNIWFELTLAAEWKLRAARVELGEPDLRLLRDDMTFLIACKRPANSKALHANIRGAVSQLNRHLQTANPNVFGVIAISLTKIFNEGTKYWSGTIEELSALMYRETRKYKRSWQAPNADPRICAIVFHVSTPSDVGRGVDMSLASQQIGEPVNGISAGTLAFRKHMTDMLAVESSKTGQALG